MIRLIINTFNMKGYNNIVTTDNKYYLNDVDKIGLVEYYPNFLKTKKADSLYQYMKDNIPWEHGIYKMFGKDIKTPRLLWAMRNKNSDIKDSYTVTESSEWTDNIKKIKKKVEKKIGKKIKYAQFNFYRDGNDYIGWHTDSEIKEGHLIASLSLGQSRLFQFKGIKTTDMHQMFLENGSLVIFDIDAGKKLWKHRLPKQSKLTEGRINLTFRLE